MSPDASAPSPLRMGWVAVWRNTRICPCACESELRNQILKFARWTMFALHSSTIALQYMTMTHTLTHALAGQSRPSPSCSARKLSIVCLSVCVSHCSRCSNVRHKCPKPRIKTVKPRCREFLYIIRRTSVKSWNRNAYRNFMFFMIQSFFEKHKSCASSAA